MATLGTTAPKISGQVPYTPADYETAQKLYQQDTQRVGEQQDALMALREEERKSKSLFAEAESAQKVNVKKAGEEQTGKYLEDIQGRQKDYETKMSANPLPTHQPTQEDLSTYAQMGSLMMTMGLMLGAGGKANAKLGLDAMTGMMTGWKKGRQDLWKQEAINFDKAFNKIKADRETIYKNLQEGMKLAATNYAAAKEKFENAAWIAGQNSVIAHGIHTGNIQSVIKNMEDVNRVNNELKDKVRNIAMGFAQRREQREESEKNRNAMIKAAQIKQDAKIGGSTTEYVQKFTGSRLKEKEAGEVMVAANAVGDAFAIKQIVTDHPEWVGRSGQIKNFFNRTIESLNFGGPSPDDEGQPELIFAKRYAEYLVNYERALAGGAKGFTVAFQQRFNKLLEQNQFNAQGMNNLMDEQIRTITSGAATKAPGLDRQNMIRMAYDMKARAGDDEATKGMRQLIGGEAPAVTQAASSKKTMPSGTKLTEYAKAHFGGDENKAKQYLQTQGYE